MPVGAAEMRRALERKFGFAKTEGGNHEKFRLIVDGQYVAHTMVSRGGSDIGDPLVSRMALQLGVTRPQLAEMVSCQIGRDAYLGLVMPPPRPPPPVVPMDRAERRRAARQTKKRKGK